MSDFRVPFNSPGLVGRELEYIQDAVSRLRLSGDGAYTQKCQEWLQAHVGGHTTLLTHSCTGALEMAAILADLAPGDEVILPSYTFVSTANAVALRGATCVFVDIRPDTLNIDERLIEEAITSRTRAIIAVHYAGVPAEMDAINEIAARHDLFVIEDAAQALLSTYKGRRAGNLGDMAAFSFHETKNVISGEGGALIVQDAALGERAEIIWEKGTNRKKFFRGMVDKYTWVDIGSSYLPSELVAAFLCAQLETVQQITEARLAIWRQYYEAFADLEQEGYLRRPVVPEHCVANGHMFYLLLESMTARDRVIAELRKAEIYAPFHYVPLHSAPAGAKYGRAAGDFTVTNDVSERLMRLPLYYSLTQDQAHHVAQTVRAILGGS